MIEHEWIMVDAPLEAWHRGSLRVSEVGRAGEARRASGSVQVAVRGPDLGAVRSMH